MKSLTLLDVSTVAVELITKNGSTTTLDVKQELRNQGFYATQEKVSAIMDELNSYGTLGFTTNGSWRTYYEKQNTPIKVQSSGTYSKTTKVKGSNKGIKFDSDSYTKRDGKVIQSVPSLSSDSYYVVSTANGGRQMYFPKDFTKDEIRQAYAKINGIHFHDTRVYLA